MTTPDRPSSPDNSFTPDKAVPIPDAELLENRDAANEEITESAAPTPSAAEKLDIAEEELKRRWTPPEDQSRS